ncbi:MAG: FAD-dependent oxidoreductase [Euryarchaeota archaeon]|nr:FAD-dependent oxidoreductase [Euryarchaeota archaeon]
MKYIILGGGLAGITTARLLHEHGHTALVLEAEAQPGGLCRSYTKDGFTFDLGGSHIIFSRNQDVLSFMHHMLADNRNERVRSTKIYYKDRYIKYPFENGLNELPKEDCYFCLTEFIKILLADASSSTKTEPKNFQEWIYQTFGAGIAECYLQPYNEKIWKHPLTDISTHWVQGRVPRPPVEDIIKSAVGIETEGYTHQSLFSYPTVGGIEALIHAIAHPIKEQIICNALATAIQKTETGWTVTAGGKTYTGDHLISTIPLQNLASCIDDLPETTSNAIDSLCYNSVACIGIGIKGTVPPYSWAYIPDAMISNTHRISFPSNFSPNCAPKGHSSILAEITYKPGTADEPKNDAAYVETLIKSLINIGLFNREDIVTTAFMKNKFGYVVYDCAYEKNISVIRRHFDETGITLLGRFSEFEYYNMDDVISSVMTYVNTTFNRLS